LLGVRVVIAESYERIHRSNLVGMGVLPLQFPDGKGVEPLGLDGREVFDVAPVDEGARTVAVTARREGDDDVRFEATIRIDTPQEWLYYRHGGILQFVLRHLLERG
jgi:aconitate hydratase